MRARAPAADSFGAKNAEPGSGHRAEQGSRSGLNPAAHALGTRRGTGRLPWNTRRVLRWDEWRGRVGCFTMTDDNIISSYSDDQAVDDGVLVPVFFGRVNRVTRPVFEHFVESPEENVPFIEIGFKLKPLSEAVDAICKVKPDGDGWRKLNYQGKELWLVPNEVGGLTLMFPDDY